MKRLSALLALMLLISLAGCCYAPGTEGMYGMDSWYMNVPTFPGSNWNEEGEDPTEGPGESQPAEDDVAIPDPEVEAKRQRQILSGDVPSPVNLPKGCCFCKRCPKAMDICKDVKPVMTEVAPGHMVACHLCGGDQV